MTTRISFQQKSGCSAMKWDQPALGPKWNAPWIAKKNCIRAPDTFMTARTSGVMYVLHMMKLHLWWQWKHPTVLAAACRYQHEHRWGELHKTLNNVAASLIIPWLLRWPPAVSHYNIYDHTVVGYVTHLHCIVLLYSDGNNISTTTTECHNTHKAAYMHTRHWKK